MMGWQHIPYFRYFLNTVCTVPPHENNRLPTKEQLLQVAPIPAR
jgi:hypothetical protein